MEKENERLLGLLRRAATLIGETLIADEFDAETTGAFKSLHDDIMAVVQRPAMPTCTKTWFVAGGRDERTCGEIAEPDQVCAECGAARCESHDDLGFEEKDGRVLCEDCIGDKTL
jgi:hypothetical protein